MQESSSDPLCYLCGSRQCTKIHDAIRYGLSPRPYRCESCGLVFLHPRMNAEEEERFYRKTYRFHYEHETPDGSFQASLPEARQRVKRVESLLGKDKRVLEIGCATGGFLSEARSRLKSVTGIELTPEYAEYAGRQGIPVVQSLDSLPDAAYDRIFLFHVLEHLQDPLSYLQQLKRKLAPQGRLIIEVPNVEDILVSVYRIQEHLDFYWEIAHHFYFSRSTLSTILDRAGYRHAIYPVQRYDLSNHIYWMLHRKPGGQGYYGDIFSPELLARYEQDLKDRFLCDTLCAVAGPECP